MNPTGVREDTDIEVKDMTTECKYASQINFFFCLELAVHQGLLESDDEAYEDLGDDFDIMGELNAG